jgi:hypothetical protein
MIREGKDASLRMLMRAVLSLSILMSAACGSDDKSNLDTPAGPSGNAKPDAATPPGPLYVVATSFITDDQRETYLVTTPSLAADATIDPTDGPKILGGVIPRVHDGEVYVTEGNRIIRYVLNAQDELQKRDELEVTGVMDLRSWHLWFVDDSKAYVFVPESMQLIVWNPSTMSPTGQQIDLSQIARDGLTANLLLEDAGPRKRGSQLLIPLSWADPEGKARHASGVLILDTATDKVVAIDEDERCGESYATIEAPNGDVYFFPPSWSAEAHYFDDQHKPTCVLSVKPGENGFTQGAPLDLSALAGNTAAAGAMPDGKSGFYFTAVNEALWEGGKSESGAFWEVWHYDFTSQKSHKVDGLPAWAGQLYYVDVGEFLLPYWQETNAGQKTMVYRLHTDAAATSMISFAANWYGISKLR